MNNLKLIKPSLDLKEEYAEMVEDWKINDEKNIPWFIDLDISNFEVMVEKLLGLSEGIGAEDSFVENSTYWMVNSGRKMIGAINIRHRLNDFFLNYGGQIGYGIRPSERRKGYAREILRMGLDICRDMGFIRVLVCCNADNIGSVKTIIGNGGILDSEGDFNGEKIQRYWIDLA